MIALVDAPAHPKAVGEAASEQAIPPRVQLRVVETNLRDPEPIAA